MTEPTRRLFFALWPEEELRRQISEQTRLEVGKCGGRPIPVENLHITLAFLGAIPESRIDDLQRCAVATPTHPFDLILTEITWWKRQALLCLEPTSGQDALVDWVGRLRFVLDKSGIEIERRPFRPHVTLAREVRREVDVQTRLPSLDVLRWTVRGMELVESTVTTNGSSYRVVTREERRK